MATPYLDEAERCSRVALLHEGRLLALDTPNHLRAAFQGDVIEVIAPIAIAPWASWNGCPAWSMCSCSASGRTSGSSPGAELADPDRLRAALQAAAVNVDGVRRVPTSLEDVFITRVSKETT